MNKKNFPIFISLLIVSLFFTVVFYWANTNIEANYKSVMSERYFDADIDSPLEKEDIEKLKTIDGVKNAGGVSIVADNAKYKDNILVISYQDKEVNQMRKYSKLINGRFADKDDEIVLSESFLYKNNLNLNDKIVLDFGRRIIDNKEIEPTSTYTDKEIFKSEYNKSYTIVGVFEDYYNKYSRVNFGLSQPSSNNALRAVLKFDSFEEAYKNREQIQNQINQIINSKVKLRFDERLIVYYGVKDSPIQALMRKAVLIFSVITCLLIFVFFIKNIFWVWGIRKIKELSIYKSIGSTDFQIYKLLLKEALWISFLPIVLGHILGFTFIAYLYKIVQKTNSISNFEMVSINPLLSLIIVFVAFLVVIFALIFPALKISKIDIVDGIKGNVDFSKSKKKKATSIWKELKLNNLASIKSQRYISAIGIIIISIFIVVVSIATYYRDFGYFDDGYNIEVDYYSDKVQIPQILKLINEDIPSKRDYIYKRKYLSIKNNINFSDEFKSQNLDEELKKHLDNRKIDYLEGFLIALEEKDFSKIGGKKGDFILYNSVQKDPFIPIANADRISYFNNPDSIDIILGENSNKNLEIKKNITNLKDYKTRVMPFEVIIYTDFDTFFNLMKEANDQNHIKYPFTLSIKVDENEVENVKNFIDQKLSSNISYNDKYDISTNEEIKERQATDIDSFKQIIIAIASIIFILNITNGYSSINMSILSRRKEIGTLYSCGMDLKELKSSYEQEFVLEQIKSFILSIVITLIVMVIISIISPTISFNVLIKYYDYKLFIGFSLLIYLINIIIYKVSLNRMLKKPTIELIKTI